MTALSTAHPQPELHPRWLTKSQAAAYLSMSESTFDENIRRGPFPSGIKLPSGCLRWDRADLDAAMEALKSGWTSPGVRNARQAPEGRRGSA